MARWRKPRTIPRLAGTKAKWKHDSLHLLGTARVKVQKANHRLPSTLTRIERRELLSEVSALETEVDALRERIRQHPTDGEA